MCSSRICQVQVLIDSILFYISTITEWFKFSFFFHCSLDIQLLLAKKINNFFLLIYVGYVNVAKDDRIKEKNLVLPTTQFRG